MIRVERQHSQLPSNRPSPMGVVRFDLLEMVVDVDVGLRSQSLAYPTLSYLALTGRRAVS